METTLALKLRISPLIIEAPNFDESSELQTPTVFKSLLFSSKK